MFDCLLLNIVNLCIEKYYKYTQENVCKMICAMIDPLSTHGAFVQSVTDISNMQIRSLTCVRTVWCEITAFIRATNESIYTHLIHIITQKTLLIMHFPLCCTLTSNTSPESQSLCLFGTADT